MLRNDLKKVKILQTQLDFHRVPGRTYKYRRVICPACYSEWSEPIYCENTACLKCRYNLRLYEIFSQRRTRYEDEEIRAGDEWEVEIAFHTGRWTYPMSFGSINRLRNEKEVDLEYYDGSFAPEFGHPIFGWDHTTGEEYGRPPEDWSEKRPETTYERPVTASP